MWAFFFIKETVMVLFLKYFLTFNVGHSETVSAYMNMIQIHKNIPQLQKLLFPSLSTQCHRTILIPSQVNKDREFPVYKRQMLWPDKTMNISFSICFESYTFYFKNILLVRTIIIILLNYLIFTDNVFQQKIVCCLIH